MYIYMYIYIHVRYIYIYFTKPDTYGQPSHGTLLVTGQVAVFAASLFFGVGGFPFEVGLFVEAPQGQCFVLGVAVGVDLCALCLWCDSYDIAWLYNSWRLFDDQPTRHVPLVAMIQRGNLAR